MKKPPTRKGKVFKIPRPENSRPLIAAAILSFVIFALTYLLRILPR